MRLLRFKRSIHTSETIVRYNWVVLLDVDDPRSDLNVFRYI